MTKAVEKLSEAQEIDHRRLTRLEGQTSLLAKRQKLPSNILIIDCYT